MSEAASPPPPPASPPPPPASPPPPPASVEVAAPESILGTGESTISGTDTNAAPAGEGTETKLEGEDSLNGGNGNDSVAATDYDLKLPEGFIPDETVLTSFKDFAKANSLTPEAAQSAVDMATGLLTTQAEGFAQAQATAWKTVNEGWVAELKADPEWQGDKFNANIRTVGKALDEYGGPELRAAFDLTGAGNHPAIVKAFFKMANALSEGTQVTANAPAPKGPRTPGQSLYGGDT